MLQRFESDARVKKYLITGASGYLASTLIPLAAQEAEVLGVARQASAIKDPAQSLQLDITQRNQVLDVILAEKPDAIIHAAACNPGGDATRMQRVNHLGSENVALAARRADCRLVAVSSDTVFSGENAPYADDAESNPLPDNPYAVSKAHAENAILEVCPEAIIVRTSLIYELDTMDRGTRGFVERMQRGEPLKLFNDVLRQPVLAAELSASLLRFASEFADESGTVNVAGTQSLSRADFGLKLMDYWQVDYQGRVELISGEGIAGLPMDLTMRLERANALGLSLSGVSNALKVRRKNR